MKSGGLASEIYCMVPVLTADLSLKLSLRKAGGRGSAKMRRFDMFFVVRYGSDSGVFCSSVGLDFIFWRNYETGRMPEPSKLEILRA